MYLSRLILNTRNGTVRRELGDVQAVHRRLLTTFPARRTDEPGARAQFGLLYRLDERATGAPQVLMQSREAPDCGVLPEGYLLSVPDNPGCRSVDNFYAAIAPGMLLRFRLRANPTRRVFRLRENEDPRWRGKRVEVRGEEDWLSWLCKKGETHGFTLPTSRHPAALPDVRMADEGKLKGNRAGPNGGSQMTLAGVLFDGHLVVSDAERFRETLRQGIGSGKAYGFGLLSVARPGA